MRAGDHVIDDGERVVDVARALGFDRTVVARWVINAKKHGRQSLRATVAPGAPYKLDDEQVELLRFLINEIEPNFFGFRAALWTRAMVAALIDKVFGVQLSVESVGRIMRDRMGLSPQRPVSRTYQADDSAVHRWVHSEYPKNRQRAELCGATIYFADEASVRSDYHSGTTWAERGKTPGVPATGARFSMNLISAISPQGQMYWEHVQGRMNAERFIEFLNGLLGHDDGRVFVTVDDHPAHRANAVRDFVEQNAERLELQYLPLYSPQLNPDELVWNHLKNHTISKSAFSVADQMSTLIIDHLEGARRCTGHGPRLLRRAKLSLCCSVKSYLISARISMALTDGGKAQ